MRAIVFDLDGTLCQFTRDYRDIVAEAFETAVGAVRAEWIDAYDEAFSDLFADCEPDVYRRAFAGVDGDLDTERCVEALREAEIAACRPPPGATADLQRLGERHHLAVLTNGVPEWQRAKLDAYDLTPRFDAVVAFYEVGTHKPGVAPFRAVERRLPADAYAMVGDDDADVEGAQAAGWTAHRYDGDGFGALPDALDWE